MEELKKILMNELKKMGIEVRPMSELVGEGKPALLVCLRLEDNPFHTSEDRLEPCADCQKSVTLAASSVEIYESRLKENKPTTVMCIQCAHYEMDN